MAGNDNDDDNNNNNNNNNNNDDDDDKKFTDTHKICVKGGEFNGQFISPP